MRCVITGIKGLVGSNLASLLKSFYGWDIVGIGSSERDSEGYIKADISNKKEVISASEKINGADVVIHCAAIIDNRRDSVKILSVNHGGTINALTLAKETGASVFINISTIQVIGLIIEKPITEDHLCSPLTYYHLSKLQAEEAIDLLCPHNIFSVSLRIPSPVGMNMPMRTILPIFLHQALNNEQITLTGDKRRRQNFLDLRDLTKAIHSLCNVGNIKGIYNIASRQPESDFDLANIIALEAGSKSVVTDDSKVNFDEYYEDWDISCKKAYDDFGFAAEFKITESIRWVMQKG